LIAGVVVGITITASMPSAPPAIATPWAWLPAEAATTPRRRSGRVELAHAVVSAADLEGEDRLQALALDPHALPRRAERRGAAFERGLDGDLGHARAQNAAQVLGGDVHRRDAAPRPTELQATSPLVDSLTTEATEGAEVGP
jgi:hypothetical protein